MKRKRLWTGLLLGSLLLTGCAQTPESKVVREKGQSVKEYQEETASEGTLQTDTAAAADTEGTGTEGAASGDMTAGAIRERLKLPEKYTASESLEDGSFSLTCDAEISVPDVTAVPVYSVTQKEFSQEWIDQVKETFFGDAPLYDGEKYFVYTKDYCLSKIDELKAYQAAGETDPYGILEGYETEAGENANLDEIWSIQREIDDWESRYQEAPEEPVKEEKTLTVEADGYSSAAVETDDGVFQIRLLSYSTYPMDIRISRIQQDNLTNTSSWYAPDEVTAETSENSEMPTPEEIRESAGITAEKATEMADAWVEKLGLSDFSAKYTLPAVEIIDTGMMQTKYGDTGYLVYYTRDVDGISVTCESDGGGALESMDSTTESWAYEALTICVNQEGLQMASILNLYELGEKTAQNVELMEFSEAASIFENMLRLKNMNLGEGGAQSYSVDHVTFGYMRIYDPGEDSKSGSLVPVWDFFGTCTQTYAYDGETYTSVSSSPMNSFLTINAADGTVIDRSLGY